MLLKQNCRTTTHHSLVEDWSFIDDRKLLPFKGVESCSTYQNFGYITLGQCLVLGGCHLKKRLLPPGMQQLRRCEGWPVR